MPALAAEVFIFTGSWMAPSGKMKVAFMLYFILFIVVTYSTLVRLALPEVDDHLWPIVQLVSALLGGGFSVWRGPKRQKINQLKYEAHRR